MEEETPYPTAKPMLLVNTENPNEIKELVLKIVNDLKWKRRGDPSFISYHHII